MHGSLGRFRAEAMLWSAIFFSPTLAGATVLVVSNGLTPMSRAAILGAGMTGSVAVGWLLGRRLLATLGTVFDLLSAIREGDYSLRARVRRRRDPLRGLVRDINALGDDLRDGRRKRTEASRFLGKTLIALGSAVFVIDDAGRLRMINPAARRLIGAERSAIIGRSIGSLGLDDPLSAADGAILTHTFAGTRGRWAVRRAIWYREGREHTLVMLQDLSAALSQEERGAWQRLIRVLSHELNNSLTPIGSLAGTLSKLVDGKGTSTSGDEMRVGLEVIGRRADALARFLAGYGRLARLPPLQIRPFRLDLALVRCVRLEQRKAIALASAEPVTLEGDEDQLAQAFINLLRNAVEATQATGGGVLLGWRVEGDHVRIVIEDEGIGLPQSDGIFVPFFTTKPEGSGIGLSLVRLIVESHAGSVELAPRQQGRGTVAVVRLPMSMARPFSDGGVRKRTAGAYENEQATRKSPDSSF